MTIQMKGTTLTANLPQKIKIIDNEYKIGDHLYVTKNGYLTNDVSYDYNQIFGTLIGIDNNIFTVSYSWSYSSVKYLVERVKMSKAKVNWAGSEVTPTVLYFKDIEVGEYFKIDTIYSKGAVYQKVKLSSELTNKSYDTYAQMEVATGVVFQPTTSEVKKVEGSVSLNAPKPNLYK